MTESTRDRILDAAIALFGQLGYRATTIGAIESAAGLAPRRGGLYRHFASKEDVFRSAITRVADQLGSLDDALELVDISDERAALTQLGEQILANFAVNAELFRLFQHVGQDFPELAAHLHQHLVQPGYDFMTELFRRLLTRSDAPTDDAPALAAIALGSLVHFRQDEATYGIPPARTSEETFLRVWVDTWVHVLRARTEGAQG